MKKLGIIVILIGLALTIFEPFTIFPKDKVVDIGNVKITRDKPYHLSWSPLIGVAIMAIGGGILLLTIRK